MGTELYLWPRVVFNICFHYVFDDNDYHYYWPALGYEAKAKKASIWRLLCQSTLENMNHFQPRARFRDFQASKAELFRIEHNPSRGSIFDNIFYCAE